MKDRDGNKVKCPEIYNIIHKHSWSKYPEEILSELFKEVVHTVELHDPLYYNQHGCNVLFDELDDKVHSSKFFAYQPGNVLFARWGDNAAKFSIGTYKHLTGEKSIDTIQFVFIYGCLRKYMNNCYPVNSKMYKYNLQSESEQGYKVVSTNGLEDVELRECIINNLYGNDVTDSENTTTFNSFLSKVLNKMSQ